MCGLFLISLCNLLSLVLTIYKNCDLVHLNLYHTITSFFIINPKFHNSSEEKIIIHQFYTLCILADSGFFFDFWYQGGVKSTVSGVFEDLKFKISEGYKQN
jgi:hypothetical protein